MTTKLELLAREYFKEVMGDSIVYYNYRPDWLKNGKTGKNFEIDIFYPHRHLAVEVNGIFHRLEKIKERDAVKRKKCNKKNVRYFYVEKISDLYQFKHRDGSMYTISEGLKKNLDAYRPSKCFNKKFNWLKKNESAVKGYDIGQEEIRRNLNSRLSRGIISKEYYDKKISTMEKKLDSFI